MMSSISNEPSILANWTVSTTNINNSPAKNVLWHFLIVSYPDGSKKPNGTKTTIFPARFFTAIVGIVFTRRNWEEMVLSGTRFIFHAPCSLLRATDFILSIREPTDNSNLNTNNINNITQYIINNLLISFMTFPSKANFSNMAVQPGAIPEAALSGAVRLYHIAPSDLTICSLISVSCSLQ